MAETGSVAAMESRPVSRLSLMSPRPLGPTARIPLKRVTSVRDVPRAVWVLVLVVSTPLAILFPFRAYDVLGPGWLRSHDPHPLVEQVAVSGFSAGWLAVSMTLSAACLVHAVIRPRTALLATVAVMVLGTLVLVLEAGLAVVTSNEIILASVVLGLWPWWLPQVSSTAPPAPCRLIDERRQRWFKFALVASMALATWSTFGSMWGGLSHQAGPLSLVLLPFAVLPLGALFWPRAATAGALVGLAHLHLSWVQLDPGMRATIPVEVFLGLAAAAVTLCTMRRTPAIVLTVAALVLFGEWIGGAQVAIVRGEVMPPPGGPAPILVVGGVLGTAAVLVVLWHRQARTLASLRQQEQEWSGRQTELSERARLARDLHDVVAHHVSLIAVRAETARYTHPDLSPSSEAVLADIADDARRVMDELRGVLGVLRRSEVEGTSTDPLPGAADLTELVARNRASGMQITLSDLRGAYALHEQTTGRGHVLYRVLQECLTNARRHAPGHAVLVVLSDSAPHLVVSNSCPGGPSAIPGAGQGVVGMRERVEALGGELVLDHGVDFRVEVHWRD